MSLAKHVDPEQLVKACLEHPHHKLTERENHDESAGIYSSRYNIKPLPKYKIPHQGVDADTAYQLIHDELELDGTPLLNLASFVHTWMPPQADKLFAENVSKNLIDEDEYKATVDLHHRCISMIAHLWNIPKVCQFRVHMYGLMNRATRRSVQRRLVHRKLSCLVVLLSREDGSRNVRLLERTLPLQTSSWVLMPKSLWRSLLATLK